MPLQHADDVMLKRMSRRVNRQQMNEQIDLMRQLLPDLVLRTTFITGFPGETEEQFQTLIEFVKRHRFERMGVFTYSLEPDTPAAKLPGHVDEDTMSQGYDLIAAAVGKPREQRQVNRGLNILPTKIADEA